MKIITVASLDRSAGKTSVIVGAIKTMGEGAAYMKPFGDRLIYRKKRLWDHDSALITEISNLKEDPVDLSVGFEHTKIMFTYDEKAIAKRLHDMVSRIGNGKDILFIEGGRNIEYGMSVNLDAITVTRLVDGEMILVVSGDEGTVLDDLFFIRNIVDSHTLPLKGVILNKVRDIEGFESTFGAVVKKTGVPILGMVPFREELTYFSVRYVAEGLMAKVIAGEEGLSRRIKTILVGAMSTDALLRTSLLQQEDKLIITAGDRSDMIVTALDSNASAVVLTNNIIPPPNIISRASDLGIPLLLVDVDTFKAAKRIDDMEPLLSSKETGKIDLLGSLIRESGLNLGRTRSEE